MILVASVMPESSQLNSSVAWGLRPFRSRKCRSTVVIKGSFAMRLRQISMFLPLAQTETPYVPNTPEMTGCLI
jgi:hypothetical protein